MKKNSLIVILWMTAAAAHGAPAAELWDIWDRHDATSTATISHEIWQLVLDEYVMPGEDGINLVAYERLAEGPGRDLLKQYIQETTAIDPRGFSKDEQFAYWVNLYNAVTIDVVLNYPNKGSILRMGKRFLSIGPWDDEVITVAGEAVTLNDIEHRILRPIWQDHRIHFAVNCASIGCPNLSKTAYRADNLEAMLDEAERKYLNHDRGVAIISDRKVRLSSIFKWYREDFADSKEGLLKDYIARHRDDVKPLLETKLPGIEYKYDWSLNRQE